MVTIKLMKLKIQELYQELNQLEKAGFTPENLKRVREIEERAKELKTAIKHKQRSLGLYVA